MSKIQWVQHITVSNTLLSPAIYCVTQKTVFTFAFKMHLFNFPCRNPAVVSCFARCILLFVIYCCFFLFSGNPEKKPWNAVYAAWGGRDRCHGKFIRGVCVFGIGDLNELASKKELFANKFYSDYQYLALDCLEEYLYNRTFNQLVFESFYYNQLPFAIKD